MKINTFEITEEKYFKGSSDDVRSDNKDFESFASMFNTFTKQEAYEYDDDTLLNIKQDLGDVIDTEKINVGSTVLEQVSHHNSLKIKQEQLDIKDESLDAFYIFSDNEYAENCTVSVSAVGRFFSCSFCNFKCSQKSRLINHQRKHPEKKLFSCSLCNYKCPQSALLTRHMITHIGENPRFGTSSYSEDIVNTEHMRVHRGEEKPFHCTHCNYKSKTRSYLNVHVRTHTGEKPYACNFCPCRMAAKSNLAAHIKGVHRSKNTFCTKKEQ